MQVGPTSGIIALDSIVSPGFYLMVSKIAVLSPRCECHWPVHGAVPSSLMQQLSMSVDFGCISLRQVRGDIVCFLYVCSAELQEWQRERHVSLMNEFPVLFVSLLSGSAQPDTVILSRVHRGASTVTMCRERL